jgi:hypothetical protein
MKMRTVAIITTVGFVIGALAGFLLGHHAGGREMSAIWVPLVQNEIVSSSFHEVVMVYPALKLLNEGKTETAKNLLQSQLHNALDIVDSASQTFHRPDMLTNSIVVRARAMDTNSAAINPVEPTRALSGARGSP